MRKYWNRTHIFTLVTPSPAKDIQRKANFHLKTLSDVSPSLKTLSIVTLSVHEHPINILQLFRHSSRLTISTDSTAQMIRSCVPPMRMFQVHLRSHLIMNGVCVRWRGWIDLERLDGVGCLEYDEERAAEEDVLLRDQIERYNQRIRDFDEKQRAYRSGAAAAAAQPPHLNHHYHHDTHHAASHHHHHHGHHSRHVGGAGATGATATGIEPHLPHRQDPEIEVRLRAY